MPFKGTSPVEERIALFREYDTDIFSVVELCQRFGVSRQAFYEWRRRRESGEPQWYEERSHATRSCPHATGEDIAKVVIATRERFPQYGPKKIKGWLDKHLKDQTWPAASTIGDILKGAGLVTARRRRRRAIAQATLAPPTLEPNAEWAIDFKGWFRTLSGRRCDPLTVTDTASRYLLEVRIVEPTYLGVRWALERLFKENGLPGAMRSDNGAPFGSAGAGGLSRLSVWWLKLGIAPHYIRPGHPQDNGRHERMHKTLKAETTRPPAGTAAEQQARFDDFRQRFNTERPHEALGQQVPAGHWTASRRPFPARIAEPWYDADHEVRRVRSSGEIKWRGALVFIGEALAGEPVGIAEVEDGAYVVHFCNRDLGVIERDRRFLRFAPPRARPRAAPETAADGGGDGG